jgi:hypothetical protein
VGSSKYAYFRKVDVYLEFIIIGDHFGLFTSMVPSSKLQQFRSSPFYWHGTWVSVLIKRANKAGNGSDWEENGQNVIHCIGADTRLRH